MRKNWYTTVFERKIVTEKKKKIPAGPTPWGAEPIRGLDYDYLDIDKPMSSDAKSIVPDKVPFNASQAQDYYTRVREKIVRWAEGAGADRDITGYVLLIPDLMALFVRLMADPRIAPALKFEIAAASAYIISPIDLLPELALGPAGLIDDSIVAVIALNRVVKMMGQAGEDVLRQNWNGSEDILKVIQDLLSRADKFVSGPVWNGIKSFMQEPESKPDANNVVDGTAHPTDKDR